MDAGGLCEQYALPRARNFEDKRDAERVVARMRKQQVEVGKSVIDSALSTQTLGGFPPMVCSEHIRQYGCHNESERFGNYMIG